MGYLKVTERMQQESKNDVILFPGYEKSIDI